MTQPVARWTIHASAVEGLCLETQAGLVVEAHVVGNDAIGEVSACISSEQIYIREIVVHEDWRCRGVATSLVVHLIDEFPGIRQVGASVETPEGAALFKSLQAQRPEVQWVHHLAVSSYAPLALRPDEMDDFERRVGEID